MGKLHQPLHTQSSRNIVTGGIDSILELADGEESSKMLISGLNIAMAHILQQLWLHAQNKASHNSITDGWGR